MSSHRAAYRERRRGCSGRGATGSVSRPADGVNLSDL